ncbi:MAG: XrtA-associated tyrosine autokinase [Methylococcaceae bacterium]|nr:XrtA-associated tyrosine autokinase [Methylococcaceae bacterium]
MDILEKALEKSARANDFDDQKITTKVQVDDDRFTQTTVNIDWHKLERLGFLSPEQPKSSLVEEYRMIKRPLINNAFGKHTQGINRANLILVTSSVPGEGKTFSAINLALSIANERDKKVLLIDADVAKPSIASCLGITESPGLIEYLESDNLTFSDISLKTDLDDLQIIPAGKRHAFSTELLSSDKMSRFVDELSQRYPDRIVIFDSPPLLAATQAEVLASLVGQVVFVISAETTAQSTVQDALKKLETIDVVLALLNKAKHELNLEYYGYGQYGH